MTELTNTTVGQPVAETVRVAIYVRTSSDKKLSLAFNSQDIQTKICTDFVARHIHLGWFVGGVYSDDITAKDTNRPGWQKLVADVDSGKFQHVVIYHLDRAFRKTSDFLAFVEWCQQRGVGFSAVDHDLSVDSAESKAFSTVIAAFAELERGRTSQRIKDCIAERRKRGMFTGGSVPFGYTVDRSDPDHKRLVPHPEASPVVKFVFENYIETHSPGEVVQRCADRGYEFFKLRANGDELDRGPVLVPHIHRILRNPTYAGYIYSRDPYELFEGEHEPIISRELFQQAADCIASNRRAQKTATRGKTEGALRGIIFCGHCDCRMSLTFAKNHGRKYRYYACAKYLRRSNFTCPKRMYNATQLEEAAFDYVRKVFRSPEFSAAVIKEVADIHQRRKKVLRDRLAALKAELKDAEHEFTTAHLQQTQEDATPATAEETLDRLRKEYKKVVMELAELEQVSLDARDVLEHLENLDKIWEHMQPELQEQVTRLLLKSVTVYEGQLKFELYVNGIRSLVDEITVGQANDAGNEASEEE